MRHTEWYTLADIGIGILYVEKGVVLDMDMDDAEEYVRRNYYGFG